MRVVRVLTDLKVFPIADFLSDTLDIGDICFITIRNKLRIGLVKLLNL